MTRRRQMRPPGVRLATDVERIAEWSADEVTSVESQRRVVEAVPCYVVTTNVDTANRTIDQSLVITDEGWGAKLEADARWLRDECGLAVEFTDFALPEVVANV